MNNKLIFADALDLLSYVLITYVTTTEVLNWIYTILLSASLLLGIILKIITMLEDKKITKQELEELREELEKAKQELTNNQNKEDTK